jgi:hypothetical protein
MPRPDAPLFLRGARIYRGHKQQIYQELKGFISLHYRM